MTSDGSQWRFVALVVAALLLLSSATSLRAFAQETPEPSLDPETVSNAAIVDLQDRIADAEDELVRVAAAESDTQAAAVRARSDLEAADRRVVETAEVAATAAEALAVADANLAHVEGVLREATDALADARDRLAATETSLAETRHLLQLRVRETWKGGGDLNTASMVLRMEEFNDAVHLQQMIRAVVADDNQLVADYLELQLARTDQLAAARAEEDRVEEARDRTAEVRGTREDAASASTAAEQAARDEQQARDATVAEVEADLANLGDERLVLEEQIDALEADLAAERRAEVERRRVEAERRAAEEAARAAAEEAARAAEEAAKAAETGRVAQTQAQVEAEQRAAAVRSEEQRRVAEQARPGSSSGGSDAGDAGETPTVAPPPPPPSGGSGCGSTSTWVWPTAGCVNSVFGYRHHPILDTRRLHAGFDIAAPAGQPIFAVADGVVHRASFSSGGHGNVVVIDHGSVATLYAHQQRLMVSAGQQVVAGQQIGTIGSTGLSTGPHLHLQVHVDGPNGPPVDPMPWFR
ncbi:M23 family metallopeptidase [Salsipaludibacter albus]|uniref:M23 family metallopeptidase n=1 Tax=Salsipaludibacter albus TaxID=2849650 RepID=UPI001EE3BC52|nr:M23 family metallopeptidase [Salsipaludibacter albus]MBY5162799.1 peptidoglycan DD-metalloendopeptidase family protein [Salsipaludibacter albus]